MSITRGSNKFIERNSDKFIERYLYEYYNKNSPKCCMQCGEITFDIPSPTYCKYCGTEFGKIGNKNVEIVSVTLEGHI